MKEMYTEELIDVVVIVKLSTSLLEMQSPVETGVPNLLRKTLLYLITVYFSDKRTWSLLSTDILLERCKHKLYIVIS